MSEARVVAVRVRDHRALDGAPGIDVEVAGFAIQAGRSQRYESHRMRRRRVLRSGMQVRSRLTLLDRHRSYREQPFEVGSGTDGCGCCNRHREPYHELAAVPDPLALRGDHAAVLVNEALHQRETDAETFAAARL